jgi:hypothetical protein
MQFESRAGSGSSEILYRISVTSDPESRVIQMSTCQKLTSHLVQSLSELSGGSDERLAKVNVHAKCHNTYTINLTRPKVFPMNPINTISGRLSSADMNFLRDPPKWIDFMSHSSTPQTLVVPSPATCRLSEYHHELLSLLMQVTSLSHVPPSDLWFQCHLASSIKLRLKAITEFIQFCYRRQMRYCTWLFSYTYSPSTKRSSHSGALTGSQL